MAIIPTDSANSVSNLNFISKETESQVLTVSWYWIDGSRT